MPYEVKPARWQVLAYIQGRAPPEAGAAAAAGPAKVKGRVIVVGAGPAGLAAAMHLKARLAHRSDTDALVLAVVSSVSGRAHSRAVRRGGRAQRCGVEVVVLEARARVGGRVYTHRGDGFSVPVDLGASIITGTATDLAKSARADPSAIVARCGLR